MQLYISFGILLITLLMFGYLLILARKIKKQPSSLLQSRAETTVFAMIGILIIDYGYTFPDKSSSAVFFFYGRNGIIIGSIIVIIAIISYIFPAAPKQTPVDSLDTSL